MYDWVTNASSGVENLDEGVHRMKITKVLKEGKAGPFVSKNGDPQIKLVFKSATGASAVETFTLSEKAGWTLARLLSRLGCDLKKMTDKGIEPASFAKGDLAEKTFLDKELWVKVEIDDRGYPRITPLKDTDQLVKAAEIMLKKPAPAEEGGEEIPF